MKHLKASLKRVGEKLTIIASDSSLDRDGETLNADDWDLQNFKKNPVLIDSHRSWGGIENIIGRVDNIRIEDEQLKGEVVFAGTPQGKIAQYLYENGFATSFSVGYDATEMKKEDGSVKPVRELYEISAVPVPANPNATVAGVAEMVVKSFDPDKAKEIFSKGVIPYSVHGDSTKAPEDAEWDAGAEVKKADVKKLKKMCTWFDSDNSESKSSYKLPHHTADGNKVVWKGVSAAGAALMGSRGGVDIPSGDIAGIKAHLAKHYKQFDKTPPWEKEEGKSKKTKSKEEEVTVVVDGQAISKVIKDVEDVKALVKLMENWKEVIGEYRKRAKVLRDELGIKKDKDEKKQINLIFDSIEKSLKPVSSPANRGDSANREKIKKEVDEAFDQEVENYPLVNNLIKKYGKESK